MKNKQYFILAISALAAGSMSLSSFATPSEEGVVNITASIGGYTMMVGLDDIPVNVAADAGDEGHFKGSGFDDFCVAASATDNEVMSDATGITSLNIDHVDTTQNALFVENGIYQLDVTANALVLNGDMANAADSKYFLDYRVVIDDIAGVPSYQVSGNNNNLTCSDNNHKLTILVDDGDHAQATGNYQGTVTVAVSGHAGS